MLIWRDWRTKRLPDPPAPEAHETLARREIEQVRVLLLAEAERRAAAERRKHLHELLTRERRMIRAEIVDKEDSCRRDVRKLTSRLEVLNREIKEIALPPNLQPE